jgi:uncharacterized protein YbcC (UPF0753/DUF2309 family)
VHHNTLHAFEHLPFQEAVVAGSHVYGCNPYLSEDAYRQQLAHGRISQDDLQSVLIDDLAERADAFLGLMGTRFHLQLAMLQHPLRLGTDHELTWLMAETDCLQRFRDEAPLAVQRTMVEATKSWIEREVGAPSSAASEPVKSLLNSYLGQTKAADIKHWPKHKWTEATLTLLWRVSHQGVHGVPHAPVRHGEAIRHRDLLLAATGRDTDLAVHEILIRFCAAFLDQGFAGWELPKRDLGFLSSFSNLFRNAHLVDPWFRKLPAELDRIERQSITPRALIRESLHTLGVTESERAEFISQAMLALRGWAGMLWQMETNAEWTVHPAPAGTLEEYLAVRLLLERLALEHFAHDSLGESINLGELRALLRHKLTHTPRVSVRQRAFLVFQLAQVRGWSPSQLNRLSKKDWAKLVEEIEEFSSIERRRIYQLAYERNYRLETLNSVSALASEPAAAEVDRSDSPNNRLPRHPVFQVVCCIDEREESFRRHLEEIEPDCESFGVAGFFGTAMYYRGVAEAHFRPLCPVNIKPLHYVQEEPLHSFAESSRFQASARREIGRMSHRLHRSSRTFLGGLFTCLFGSLTSIPLLTRVWLPRATARIRRSLALLMTPPVTQLRLERVACEPGPLDDQLGYNVAEMSDIVGNVLRAIGLTHDFAPLVIITGHGSSSLNNPQEAAHDCGACGGARGGPNARAFARMANDHRVRRILAEKGLSIPDQVVFVGAYHNTCDDDVTYFDLDLLAATHRQVFKRARLALHEARARNAHERCRRFESAKLGITFQEALRHVEARAEDLSQTRPEYGHATNASCIVGRRSRTRGLFLDRRAFLASYDPTQDDSHGSILAGLLSAVVPVCAGISLEYYFSSVDPAGYGCGTKLPHNISALLGVMDGAASDLRPGLPWQMVEIHEPMRILFLVESTPEIMTGIVEGNETIARLLHQGWVQLATLDPHSPTIHVFCRGEFERFVPDGKVLPIATSSADWYRASRDNLRFARIKRDSTLNSHQREVPTP